MGKRNRRKSSARPQPPTHPWKRIITQQASREERLAKILWLHKQYNLIDYLIRQPYMSNIA